jgi:hypothetical protein
MIARSGAPSIAAWVAQPERSEWPAKALRGGEAGSLGGRSDDERDSLVAEPLRLPPSPRYRELLRTGRRQRG